MNPNGRVVIALEKNQQLYIECGNRKVEIWPDNPQYIIMLIEKHGLDLEKQYETEFSNVMVAKK